MSQPDSPKIDKQCEREQRGHTPFTRSWLESLSTGELVNLADCHGIDIPSGMGRFFIIEELLDASLNAEGDAADNAEIRERFMETAALPKQYNISFLEVIIRDPLWAFVLWEIKEHDREIHENAPDFGGYCLRVIPLNDDKNRNSTGFTGDESFTVAVNVSDTARYLGFPVARENVDKTDDSMQEQEGASDRSYIIKLCAIRGSAEMPLVVSRPFSLPRLVEAADRNGGSPKVIELYQNPCISLSGAHDFSVMKSADRQLRIKRQ